MKKLLIASALLLASSAASAGIIVESGSFGIQGSSANVSIGTLNETISINAFDTMLGNLTSVTVQVSGQMDATGFTTNTTAGENMRASVTTFLTQAWEVTTTAADDYTFGSAFTPVFSTESSAAGVYTIGTGDTYNFAMTTNQLDAMLGSVSLAAFTTGAAVDFNFDATASTSLTNDFENGTGTTSNSVATGSWGQVTVTYDYDAFPPVTVSEPTSLAILGLGLAGFALSRKAKKSA